MTAATFAPASLPVCADPGVPGVASPGPAAGKLGVFAILLQRLTVTVKGNVKAAAEKGALIAKPQKPNAAIDELPAILTVPIPLPLPTPQPVDIVPDLHPATAPELVPAMPVEAHAEQIDLPADVAFMARLTPKDDKPDAKPDA